jgi:hypothetical protein
MSNDIYHPFVDLTPDDPALIDCVRPSDWNAAHKLAGNPLGVLMGNGGGGIQLATAGVDYTRGGVDFPSGDISITTTATATIGRQHVCSGTTANYTVTLPTAAGNAGKLLAFRMDAGLTKLVTIQGNGAELIDGSNTRIMWANETATLYCDGVGWSKIAGRFRSMSCGAHKYSQTAIVGWTRMVLDTLETYSHDMLTGNSGSLKVLRPGTYAIYAFATGSIPTTTQVGVSFYYNGSGVSVGGMGAPNAWASSSVTAIYPVSDVSKPLDVYAFTSVLMTNGMNGIILVTEITSW